MCGGIGDIAPRVFATETAGRSFHSPNRGYQGWCQCGRTVSSPSTSPDRRGTYTGYVILARRYHPSRSSDHHSFSCTTMLHRKVSSPSLKVAVATIKSMGSANSPGPFHGVSSFNFHHQGSALASPQHSPRFLDFHPTASQSPTTTKSRLECHTVGGFFSPSGPTEPSPPDASWSTKV